MLIPFSKTEASERDKIGKFLGKEEVLSQLSEECGELIHAAQKLRRVIHGTTYVTADIAHENLNEEVADVLFLIDILIKDETVDWKEVVRISKFKTTHWHGQVIPGMAKKRKEATDSEAG